MDKIELIPVEQLMHHPDNPRKDLGDLSELVDSIRANGILQNLTVVPVVRDMTDEEWQDAARLYHDHPTEELRTRMNEKKYVDPDHYWVVIGNRRFEAAQMAGITELPCVVVDMDQKTQVATMLQENMQRADLTVYEQAQGFQMMMDLGFNEDQISERTGFSKTTVKRRLKMAELDPKQLKKACEDTDTERQVTLADFERLAQVEDVKKRNELLKTIGSNGFDWMWKRAIQTQKAKKVINIARKIIRDAGLKAIPKGEKYGGKYDSHWDWRVKLYEWNEGDKLLPKTDEELFYEIDDDTIQFYTKHKKAKPDPANKRTEAEIAEDKKREEAWKAIKDDSETAAQLRREFADKLKVTSKNVTRMMYHLMVATVMAEIDYTSCSENIRELFGLSEVTYTERLASVREKFNGFPISEWSRVIRAFFDADNKMVYYEGYQREMPRYKPNLYLDAYYDWLTEFGYQLSPVEIQLMSGTHPSFEVKSHG